MPDKVRKEMAEVTVGTLGIVNGVVAGFDISAAVLTDFEQTGVQRGAADSSWRFAHPIVQCP